MRPIHFTLCCMLVMFLSSCTLPVVRSALQPIKAPLKAQKAVAATVSSKISSDPPADCPVTQRQQPVFVPPPPNRKYPAIGEFLYGSDMLWTALPDSGAWSGLPYDLQSYSQKMFWWRKGYSWQAEPEPKLSVTGQRLDAPAPPFHVSRATNAFAQDIQSAMLVGVDFPTLGCWEITGRYAGNELSVVIWVSP